MRERLESIILSAAETIAGEVPDAASATVSLETSLYGQNGIFDSIGLVSFIAEVEARVAEELDRDVVLADEKAMSRHRSPFRSAGTVVDYVESLLLEPV